MSDNKNVKKRVSSNFRLMDKIRDNQFRNHSRKSSVKHRERTYVSKLDFKVFHQKCVDSIEILVKMMKESFKRDQVIWDSMIKGQFHPSGMGLQVKDALHLFCKEYNNNVIKKGFPKMKIPIYQLEDDENIEKLEFGGSEAEWMDNKVKFEEKSRGRSHKRSRSVKGRR